MSRKESNPPPPPEGKGNNPMDNNKTIKLGDRVADNITGFQGIVIAITYWLNGCTRCGVQSTELEKGLPPEPQWFDTPQLKIRK